MKDIWIRYAGEDDFEQIYALTDAAFGGKDETQIIQRLDRDGDNLLSLVAHNDREILAHVQFFPVLIDGADIAAGFGPMSVAPEHQRKGIGAGLLRFGLTLMEGAGRQMVFVLGHPDYYPRFGFDAETAKPFEATWSGPAFMALRFGEGGPAGGALTYPAAFGA